MVYKLSVVTILSGLKVSDRNIFSQNVNFVDHEEIFVSLKNHTLEIVQRTTGPVQNVHFLKCELTDMTTYIKKVILLENRQY